MDILGLIDIVLVANLLLIIIFSGYESFVSKIDMIHGHVDRPDWMGTINYSALKLKVIGSIVAISSIELLKVFIKVFNHPQDVQSLPYEAVMWLILLHLTFVVSGVLFALMERLTPHSHSGHPAPAPNSEEHH
ncbi:MAG: YqhA family protein [Thiotrichaceae bacterium]